MTELVFVLFFFSLYRAPSILVHSGRMRKWGLISPDGRWIDSRSLWSRYMSSAITISDRFFCTFVSWENSGRLHPIHPVAHSTPSSAAVPLIYPLDHGPPRGAHYLIENCLHTRALVSNYRCGCIEKWLFPKKIDLTFTGIINGRLRDTAFSSVNNRFIPFSLVVFFFIQ